MILPINRRSFLHTLLASAAAATVPGLDAAENGGFSFALLGDLHYDKLAHHELDWLQRDKPDDLRQVREYSQLTAETVPTLFARLRETIGERQKRTHPVRFVVQVGDLVEGLCGSENLALQQNNDAVAFLQKSLEIPFLFTKGNHDITGQGAPEAFKTVFHPFISAQASRLQGSVKLEGACYAVPHAQALFCFFDAYDKESLPWLEAALARRTQTYCFLVLHPPVVPYGARSIWHVFSSERDRAKREHLLDLLGSHNVFVLSGHIHKYNLTVRTTGGRGRFVQVGLSSVITNPRPEPHHLLSGVQAYNPDQVTVEPDFSPGTEQQRREVYESERRCVREFQYADLPGYAIVEVSGTRVVASVYSGLTPTAWRSLDLTKLLTA